ncbi:unnamed protein product, partial [Polarella glacialis]
LACWKCRPGAPGAARRRAASYCRAQTVDNKNNNNNKSSCGRQLPQGVADELQQLLNLGESPSQNEVFEIIRVELDHWNAYPRRATVVLISLARHQLPDTARSVLAVMLARSVETNLFHHNAVITAFEKGGQWQPALSLLSSMPDVRVIPNEISCNAAISAC